MGEKSFALHFQAAFEAGPSSGVRPLPPPHKPGGLAPVRIHSHCEQHNLELELHQTQKLFPNRMYKKQ